jgi:hypothetical protein
MCIHFLVFGNVCEPVYVLHLTAVCDSIDVLCGLLAEDIRRDMDAWAAAYPNARQERL